MLYQSSTINSLKKLEMTGLVVDNYMRSMKGKPTRIVDGFPGLTGMPRTYLGAFVWSTPSERLMNRPFARSVCGVYMSPADIARNYLSVKYSGQRRRTHSDAYCKCFVPRHKSIPLFAEPQSGNLVYLDIKSAYWNIVRTVGWDVDYHPGEFIGVRSSNEDFPFSDDKLARNILVSAGLPARSQVWTGKRIISTKARNKLYNGILWCFVQDVLNSFAADMIDAGAIYAHTDGFIFHQRDELSARQAAKQWGLPLGVKYRGRGEVYGVSNYWIEGKKNRRPRSGGSRNHSNVDPVPNRRWLRDQFLFWREHRKLPIDSSYTTD